MPWFKELLLPIDEEGIIKFCGECNDQVYLASESEDVNEFSESEMNQSHTSSEDEGEESVNNNTNRSFSQSSSCNFSTLTKC